MEEDGPVQSDPMAVDTFADYPSVRTKEEAHEEIAEQLSEYGVDPLEEDLSGSENALMNIGSEAGIQSSFLEAVWAEQIRQDALAVRSPDYDDIDPSPSCVHGPDSDPPDRYTVTVEEVARGFEKRTGTALEDLPDGILVDRESVCVTRPDDEEDEDEQRGRKSPTRSDVAPEGMVRISDPEAEVAVTDQGIRNVLEQADEEWNPETEKHNEALRRAFVSLSAVGME
ncbi:hypothetical protein EXE45_17255, partial [Halorubrum sp. SP9]